jgi:hypothetical protein
MADNWSWFIVLIALILILIWVLTRTRKHAPPRLQSAIGMISDINENQKILETRRIDPQSPKKFKTGAWKAYYEKCDYFDAETLAALKETYTLINDMNLKIEIAKKTQSLETLKELPLDKLKDPLTKSKDGMVKWLRDNLQTETQSRRNIFGF